MRVVFEVRYVWLVVTGQYSEFFFNVIQDDKDRWDNVNSVVRVLFISGLDEVFVSDVVYLFKAEDIWK